MVWVKVKNISASVGGLMPRVSVRLSFSVELRVRVKV